MEVETIIKQAIKYLSPVLFSGMMFLTTLKAQAQGNQQDFTKEKQEVFEVSVVRKENLDGWKSVDPFVGDDTWLERNIEDFGGTGLHQVHIFMRGEPTFRYICDMIIIIVDRETRDFEVAFANAAKHKSLKEGEVATFSSDNINYEFTVVKCPSSWEREEDGIVRIRRTIPDYPSLIADNLYWEMTGEFKEEVIDVNIREISWANIENYGLSIANSREVSFEKNIGESYSGSISNDLLELGLERQVGKASGVYFGQIAEESRTTTLDGKRCKAWLLKKINISEQGKASAPKLGITEQLEMTVLRGYFYESEPLCYEKSGSNEPDPKLVDWANEQVEIFKVKQQEKLTKKQFKPE